jgi:hypothetical protein
MYRQSLPLHRQSGDRVNEAKALDHIALVQEQRGRLPAPSAISKTPSRFWKYPRRTGRPFRSQGQFPYLHTDTYHRYIHLLLKRNKTAALSPSCRRPKRRALLDLMASGRVDIGQQLTGAEKQREQDSAGAPTS